MHTLLTLEWAKAGPGGEGEGHIWSSARVPGPLQQLWQHLPQWGQVCGEAQWILLRLHQFTIWRTLLQKRYNRIYVFPTGVFYCLQIVVTSQETRALRESSNIHLLSLNFPLCRLSGLLLNIITYTHPHVCGGEGNGNPLQCSCLENPWTEGPAGLQSMGSHRVGHGWSDLACMHTLEKEMATHSSVLAWRIPGAGEPGGLPSMG